MAHTQVQSGEPGQTMYLCGCRALSDFDHRVPPKLEWCPLHATAPELLKELREVRAWMRYHLSKRLHPTMDDAQYERIDATIRKAMEGQ